AFLWSVGNFLKPQRFPLKRAGRFVDAGFVLLTLYLVARGVRAGFLPAIGAFSAMTIYLWCVALTYIILDRIFQLTFVLAFITPLLLLFALPSLFLDRSVPELPPSFRSLWFILHMILGYMGYALVSLGFVVAIDALLVDRMLKRKRIGRLLESLPPMETLERLLSILLSLSFPTFTVAVFFGLLWAHWVHEWAGGTWYTDPKILLSFLLWGYYGLLFLLRRRLGGRRLAYGMIGGFLLAVCAFVGILLFRK
ncbi:MAG: hypothetical protein D6812_15875, partial [Deltaproteobacteria bacterium]